MAINTAVPGEAACRRLAGKWAGIVSGAGAKWFCMVALVAGLSACASQFGPEEEESPKCAVRRLRASTISFEDAKNQFAEHFKLRSDTALVFAFHASVDSVRLARSVRSCFDFNKGFENNMFDLIDSNQILQRLIVSNFRDPDPHEAVGLFGDQYSEIFKNDIN